ncbi:hypothetical protein ABEF94_014562 [Exophiala dermatitidis]
MGSADDAKISRRGDGYVWISCGFYMLWNCATSVWLAGQSPELLEQTGSSPHHAYIVHPRRKCYKREGVNHLEKCGKYRERYLQLLKGNKEKGYRGRQQNYVPGVDGPAGGPEIQTTYPTAQQAKGAKGSDYRPGNTTGNGGDVLY